MWSRKRLDIGWSDLLFGLCRVCLPPDRATVAARVEGLWPAPEHMLACLSVRSGFDLLLDSLKLPRGSEVLVSAITIPDMVRIIKHHGLVLVPVDLDPQRMAPSIEDWQRAITPATKAILMAHLFGGRTDMGPLADLARRRRLLLIEDCAQAFAGVGYQGHPEADTSMFSFGTIKYNTALGGAVLRVRDRSLLDRMRVAQAAYPVQGRWPYLKRLAKCAVLKTLACRPICATFVHICRAVGCNYDRWVNRMSRGFPGDDLLVQIRRQPSAPLLAVLERRLQGWDARRSEQHTAKGQNLAKLLRDLSDGTPSVSATLGVSCPGAMVEPNTHWVFPILVEEPDRLLERLARAGFDATQGQSLRVVAPPAEQTERRAMTAEGILRNIVFLPFYPELPTRQSQRMAEIVLQAAAISSQFAQSSPTARSFQPAGPNGTVTMG